MIGTSLRAAAERASRRRLLAAAAVIALALVVVGGAFAGVRAQASDDATKHCVAEAMPDPARSIEPLQPSKSASNAPAAVCFDTFEEALEFIGVDPDDLEASQTEGNKE